MGSMAVTVQLICKTVAAGFNGVLKTTGSSMPVPLFGPIAVSEEFRTPVSRVAGTSLVVPLMLIVTVTGETDRVKSSVRSEQFHHVRLSATKLKLPKLCPMTGPSCVNDKGVAELQVLLLWVAVWLLADVQEPWAI